MPNRSMAAKAAKAKTQATEAAIQSAFKDATRPLHDRQMIDGKLVPRPEPKTLDQLKAEYAAKLRANAELRKIEAEGRKGEYRSSLRDHRALFRYL